MKKRSTVAVSRGEMEVLAMLWEEGRLGLAEAHRRFGRYGRAVGYPTMQTRLNRLVAKGFVSRSEDRPAMYEAILTRDQAAAGHLDQLLQTARHRSVVPLVAHLISERPLTSDEIRELKRLLAESARSALSQEPDGD
jgi:predicted transcriptional regulator